VIANNSTNINKMNNHLPPQTIKHKKDHVFASDRHENMTGLNHVNGIPSDICRWNALPLVY